MKRVVDGFVPHRVFDFHTHILRDSDFDPAARPAFSEEGLVVDVASLRSGVEAWLPERELRALCFGIPQRLIDCQSVNEWVGGEVRKEPGWKALALAGPDHSPEQVARQLSDKTFVGLKVYHLLSQRPDSFNCELEEFAPAWMWELLHSTRGVMMLHIVKDAAMADPENQAAVRQLCQRYPNCQLILAHVGRSFSHRHALDGLKFLRDLDNVWVDTSAVCEAQAFTAAIEILGPDRILFGSDFPISNFRGRSSALGESFQWMYEDESDPSKVGINAQMTLVGLESLRALREAAESSGLTSGDLDKIFYGNAELLLGEKAANETTSWNEVKSRISCGTGLMSKRQELFDPKSWPTFFSRCHGASVWDESGQRYVDFAGGVGAILLGYADGDIERALRRRLSSGTYCTLVNPEEDQLARLLLRLHPWAGRVRFSRGGGEAMAIAVRIARAATGRSGVAFCGYHGWQDWYLAANLGADTALDGHLLPGLQPLGVPRELKGTSAPFVYNDFESLQGAVRSLGGRPAAIVMEPMRSQLPQNDFILKVKAFAAELGAVFVLDEVTSGWRFGFPGAHTRLGFEPDIAVYAKAMSNGFPCAAVVGREGVMNAADHSFISSSYWTDAMGTAAALACLQKIERTEASAAIWETGTDFCKKLRELAEAHPACKLSVGGMPPSPSLAFGLGPEATAAKVLMIRGLARRRFLGSSQLYLMQSHTMDLQNQFLGALDDTLLEIEKEISRGTLTATSGAAAASNTFARLA